MKGGRGGKGGAGRGQLAAVVTVIGGSNTGRLLLHCFHTVSRGVYLKTQWHAQALTLFPNTHSWALKAIDNVQ